VRAICALGLLTSLRIRRRPAVVAGDPDAGPGPVMQRAAGTPVTGMLPDGRTFTGQLSRMAVSMVNGAPMLSGLLKGTGLPAAGAPFTTAISSAQATCQVMDLNVPPMHLDLVHLDLLGLVVDLDAVHLAGCVHLAINAVQGPCNLLGNLLCSLANAANPGGVPTRALFPRRSSPRSCPR
jgi:hypothetical protein